MPNSDVAPLVKGESNKRPKKNYLQYFSSAAGNYCSSGENLGGLFKNLYLRVFLKSLVATYRKECISIHTNSYHLPRAYFCQLLNYVLYILCSFNFHNSSTREILLFSPFCR